MQDALGVDAFSSSEQAFAAEKLLEAYRCGDAGAVRKSVASQNLFLDLDNQVMRAYPGRLGRLSYKVRC